MNASVAYGKGELDFHLPDHGEVTVLEPPFTPGVADPDVTLRKALRQPIGGEQLSRLVRPSDTVGIVFSDITRPMPYRTILPALLEELSGIPDRNIVLFNATGTHRTNTREELVTILGRTAVERFEIVQNVCDATDSHRHVGTTSSGNNIEILSRFLDCDVRIPTGFIEPHFFAGMSGGGKAIMPGLAGLDTIRRNHSAAHMDNPQARWGITEGNPLWEEVTEAALLARPSFIVNVALNRNKEITAVFAGDFLEAHKAGVNYVRNHAMVPVEREFDIVITGNSGYPLDLNMYQSVKGMSAARQIVRPGGHIILAAECWDGIPDHGEYGKLLAGSDTPESLLRRIRTPGFAVQDMWQAQIHALICQDTTVHFYSDNIRDEQIIAAFMQPVRDIGKLVVTLMENGAGNRICVLPQGPMTIPYVQEGSR